MKAPATLRPAHGLVSPARRYGLYLSKQFGLRIRDFSTHKEFAVQGFEVDPSEASQSWDPLALEVHEDGNLVMKIQGAQPRKTNFPPARPGAYDLRIDDDGGVRIYQPDKRGVLHVVHPPLMDSKLDAEDAEAPAPSDTTPIPENSLPEQRAASRVLHPMRGVRSRNGMYGLYLDGSGALKSRNFSRNHETLLDVFIGKKPTGQADYLEVRADGNLIVHFREPQGTWTTAWPAYASPGACELRVNDDGSVGVYAHGAGRRSPIRHLREADVESPSRGPANLLNKLIAEKGGICSKNDQFRLYLTPQGELVLWDLPSEVRTQLDLFLGKGTRRDGGRWIADHLDVLPDGNLTVHFHDEKNPESTQTRTTAWPSQRPKGPCELRVGDDGSVCVYARHATQAELIHVVHPSRAWSSYRRPLEAGEKLRPNQAIASTNGDYELFLEIDGSLTYRRLKAGTERELRLTGRKPGNRADHLLLHPDGTVEVRFLDTGATWRSGWPAGPPADYRLGVNDDGSVTLTKPDDSEALRELIDANGISWRGSAVLLSERMLDANEGLRSGPYGLLFTPDGEILLKNLVDANVPAEQLFVTEKFPGALSLGASLKSGIHIHGRDGVTHLVYTTSQVDPARVLKLGDDGALRIQSSDGREIFWEIRDAKGRTWLPHDALVMTSDSPKRVRPAQILKSHSGNFQMQFTEEGILIVEDLRDPRAPQTRLFEDVPGVKAKIGAVKLELWGGGKVAITFRDGTQFWVEPLQFSRERTDSHELFEGSFRAALLLGDDGSLRVRNMSRDGHVVHELIPPKEINWLEESALKAPRRIPTMEGIRNGKYGVFFTPQGDLVRRNLEDGKVPDESLLSNFVRNKAAVGALSFAIREDGVVEIIFKDGSVWGFEPPGWISGDYAYYQHAWVDVRYAYSQSAVTYTPGVTPKWGKGGGRRNNKREVWREEPGSADPDDAPRTATGRKILGDYELRLSERGSLRVINYGRVLYEIAAPREIEWRRTSSLKAGDSLLPMEGLKSASGEYGVFLSADGDIVFRHLAATGAPEEKILGRIVAEQGRRQVKRLSLAENGTLEIEFEEGPPLTLAPEHKGTSSDLQIGDEGRVCVRGVDGRILRTIVHAKAVSWKHGHELKDGESLLPMEGLKNGNYGLILTRDRGLVLQTLDKSAPDEVLIHAPGPSLPPFRTERMTLLPDGCLEIMFEGGNPWRTPRRDDSGGSHGNRRYTLTLTSEGYVGIWSEGRCFWFHTLRPCKDDHWLNVADDPLLLWYRPHKGREEGLLPNQGLVNEDDDGQYRLLFTDDGTLFVEDLWAKGGRRHYVSTGASQRDYKVFQGGSVLTLHPPGVLTIFFKDGRAVTTGQIGTPGMELKLRLDTRGHPIVYGLKNVGGGEEWRPLLDLMTCSWKPA